MSIPIIGKIIKNHLNIKSQLFKPDKPEWFDPLVNKVILEGDEVTKFATKDRGGPEDKDNLMIFLYGTQDLMV